MRKRERERRPMHAKGLLLMTIKELMEWLMQWLMEWPMEWAMGCWQDIMVDLDWSYIGRKTSFFLTEEVVEWVKEKEIVVDWWPAVWFFSSTLKTRHWTMPRFSWITILVVDNRSRSLHKRPTIPKSDLLRPTVWPKRWQQNSYKTFLRLQMLTVPVPTHTHVHMYRYMCCHGNQSRERLLPIQLHAFFSVGGINALSMFYNFLCNQLLLH